MSRPEDESSSSSSFVEWKDHDCFEPQVVACALEYVTSHHIQMFLAKSSNNTAPFEVSPSANSSPPLLLGPGAIIFYPQPHLVHRRHVGELQRFRRRVVVHSIRSDKESSVNACRLHSLLLPPKMTRTSSPALGSGIPSHQRWDHRSQTQSPLRR